MEVKVCLLPVSWLEMEKKNLSQLWLALNCCRAFLLPFPCPKWKIVLESSITALKSFHSSFQVPFLLPSHTQASLGRGWESLAETCRMLNNNGRVSFKEGIMCLDCTYPKLYFPCFDVRSVHASLPGCFLICPDVIWSKPRLKWGWCLSCLWRDSLPRASTEAAGVCHVQTAVSEHMKWGQ